MSLSQAALAVMRINLLVVSLASAYNIRLYAVQNYGRVIHEFDPWFNYRAAEYLAEHGTERFFKWFDHTVWYPLGRPVGTTIYPGMQFAAVWIWRILEFLQQEMSLHDVCVFIPAWFGVASTVFVGLWTFECTRCVDSAVCAMLVVSILPAHLMRSVAGLAGSARPRADFVSRMAGSFWSMASMAAMFGEGGFDNECMAITFMNATFYFWCRSLRNDNSWPWALLAGFSYFCMVATWGGYVYVVNIIACHAACLMLLDAVRSLEQVAPLLQFVAVQIFEVLSTWQRRLPAKLEEFQLLRFRVFAVCGAVAALLGAMLFQLGYFAPLSSRVRGLFVKHRTGNPLVDSVAEHQATSPRAYWQFFHHMCTMAPLGFLISLFEMSEARNFLLLYAGITYYFSSKMNRLLLLLGPTAAALGGIALAKTLRWALHQLTQPEEAPVPATQNEDARFKGPLWEAYHEVLMLLTFMICGMEFMNYCWAVAERLSQASIIVKRRNKEGQEILMDDYRESYWWLRDHTPEDTRIMAWWDYGYQINGLTNRTTLADGNTWNHEHIALIGRCLTGPERQAHEAPNSMTGGEGDHRATGHWSFFGVIRHLADYVLIWAGDYGDDIAKSSHMARIAASVYEDVCPGSKFHRNRQTGEPSEMMSRSLLWKLYAHDPMGEVQTDGALFEEAYTSQYGLVRIFKVLNISDESKAWAADPNNWKCDAPGSWHCQGQYPPALSKVLEKQKAFQQLEDFNQQKDEKAEEYHKATGLQPGQFWHR
ncbi:Dolichyl-diphosphooligosaccharide--protein glycosyltransferase subunit STT3A (Oligosaccharyl transferase subunit STT3A) (STT3-A) [Durusdinium trenchii]|uniref:dolichyl-diphosphooligosaccharide--protein glycotransferase n=1 Tax=Durusdinium trenchii TaxID=1381693 RepID=A0ABP0NH38_9DINO